MIYIILHMHNLFRNTCIFSFFFCSFSYQMHDFGIKELILVFPIIMLNLVYNELMIIMRMHSFSINSVLNISSIVVQLNFDIIYLHTKIHKSNESSFLLSDMTTSWRNVFFDMIFLYNFCLCNTFRLFNG